MIVRKTFQWKRQQFMRGKKKRKLFSWTLFHINILFYLSVKLFFFYYCGVGEMGEANNYEILLQVTKEFRLEH